MFDGRLGSRVSKLESNLTALSDDVKEVRDVVTGFGSKIDQVVAGLSSTGERAAQRAYAVKTEMRDETDRKAKDRSSLMRDTLSLLGFVSLVVAAFCGPYLNKINSTAQGQADDTYKIGQVRETIAGLGANQGQMQVLMQQFEAEAREHDRDIAFQKGYLAARMGAQVR